MGSCFSSPKKEKKHSDAAHPAPDPNTNEPVKKDVPQQQTTAPNDSADQQEQAFDPFSAEHNTGAPRKPSAFELASASYAPATTFTGPEGKKDELPAITDEEEQGETAARNS
ncbi:hypothetical protein BDZ45DRAFT_699412 [Acephala macrosclerotiorum]|nr:hypothetical protein BDZ45DRAFT_699412 [Acephala macrosclerotiorum]